MSLISQKDRKLAIEALEFYSSSVLSLEKRMELNALINWIKLEVYKNEN
jgi:hypothetical protein